MTRYFMRILLSAAFGSMAVLPLHAQDKREDVERKIGELKKHAQSLTDAMEEKLRRIDLEFSTEEDPTSKEGRGKKTDYAQRCEAVKKEYAREMETLGRETKSLQRALYRLDHPDRSEPGFLGIRVADLSPEQKKTLGVEGGVFLIEAFSKSQCSLLLRPWDLIVGVDGESVRDERSLRERIAKSVPGEEIFLEYKRPPYTSAETVKAYVKAADGKAFRQEGEFGFMDLSADQLKNADLSCGVVVTRIPPGVTTEGAEEENGTKIRGGGIRVGDVLLSVRDSDTGSEVQAKKASEVLEFVQGLGERPFSMKLRGSNGIAKSVSIKVRRYRWKEAF